MATKLDEIRRSYLEILRESGRKSHYLGIGYSMKPLISSGDEIITVHKKPQEIRKGDIIIYIGKNNFYYCHRVIDVKEGKKLEFTVKGDNSPIVHKVFPFDIIGKVNSIKKYNFVVDLDTQFWRIFNYMLANYFQIAVRIKGKARRLMFCVARYVVTCFVNIISLFRYSTQDYTLQLEGSDTMKIMDGQDIKRARDELVDRLDIRYGLLERAFRIVPRHILLKDIVDPIEAYRDKTFVLKSGDKQAISSSTLPSLIMAMLDFSDLKMGMKIMEIGTASGYTAALLAEIVGKQSNIYTIEFDEKIVGATRANLKIAGYENINVINGDGWYGHSEAGPYDRIIVTAGTSDFSPYWLEQIKDKGKILVPLSFYHKGGMYPIVKLTRNEGTYVGQFTSQLLTTNFTPLLGKFQKYRYDQLCFRLLAKIVQIKLGTDLPRITNKFRDHAGLMLVCILEIGKLREDEMIRMDTSASELNKWFQKISDYWHDLGKPRAEEFRLRICAKEPTDGIESRWTFSREKWNLITDIPVAAS